MKWRYSLIANIKELYLDECGSEECWEGHIKGVKVSEGWIDITRWEESVMMRRARREGAQWDGGDSTCKGPVVEGLFPVPSRWWEKVHVTGTHAWWEEKADSWPSWQSHIKYMGLQNRGNRDTFMRWGLKGNSCACQIRMSPWENTYGVVCSFSEFAVKNWISWPMSNQISSNSWTIC